MKIPTQKRLAEISVLLEQEGFVKAKDLVQKYQVSMETIRKDLKLLEEKGIAKKEYGGASISMLNIEKAFVYRSDKVEEKKAIANLAASFLSEQKVVIIDSGTTCLFFAKYINSFDAKDIITNSVSAYEILDGNKHNVFLTGGKKREKSNSMIGNWTETFLKNAQVDICFLGTSGLLGSAGPTSYSYHELGTKRAMIKQSELVFVLADSDKFRKKGFHTFADWSEIDGIITDQKLSLKLYEEYSKKVPVYMVEGEKE
ncbi:MAG: DeoR/GlpR family DNA-binding transcription regulator [Breznakia sp.]